MYWKPPQIANNPANPFWHPLNKKTQPINEAVTVELDFKSDAEGKKAGGKMVRKGVYKMTFKNNAEMNKFMDTHSDKLNEGTADYRAMMKKYKGSDAEKVFKILDKEGFRMGEQSDTLVRNMLKKHRGNVKKAADQIMKDNPGMFDVNKMMMDHVEIDEENVYKRPARVSALGGQKFHAIVDSKGNIVSAGLSEKEAKERKTFGQKVRELPGAKVGQVVKENVKIDDIDEYVNLHEESMAQGEQDFSWNSVTELIQYFMQVGNPNQGQLLALDFNRDGVIDFSDLTIALSLWSQGLPPMFADMYDKYMDSDARSGVKQQAGSQIQLGQRPGDLAARPPVASPTTGGMRESVELDEEVNPPTPDQIWDFIIRQTQRLALDPSLPYNSGFDWNGDGVNDLQDVQLAVQLFQQGLSPMLATQYLTMMAKLDAKTGQRVGPKAPMNPLGAKAGSRPTQPPPPDMSGGAGGR